MKKIYIHNLKIQVLFVLVFCIVVVIAMYLVISDKPPAFPPNGTIVEIAESQVGNKGGKPYWSWYGFDEHVDWCACFVSWCADKSRHGKGGSLPRFSYCPDGVSWFISKECWYGKEISPKDGMIIFFDRNSNGQADHVGIVSQCEEGTVHTIEGNSENRCLEREYPVGSDIIYGYGKIP